MGHVGNGTSALSQGMLASKTSVPSSAQCQSPRGASLTTFGPRKPSPGLRWWAVRDLRSRKPVPCQDLKQSLLAQEPRKCAGPTDLESTSGRPPGFAFRTILNEMLYQLTRWGDKSHQLVLMTVTAEFLIKPICLGHWSPNLSDSTGDTLRHMMPTWAYLFNK